MSDPSAPTLDSTDELLRLFWQRLGYSPPPDDATLSPQDAARRIVAAVGPSPAAVSVAAACAVEFSLPLAPLANALEHPSEDVLVMTARPPTGSALVAATAVEQGERRQDGGDLPGAEHAFRWATQQFHVLGEDAESLAVTLLGRAVEMQDRLDEAAQCYHQALAIDQAIGDDVNEGVDLGLLGQVAWLRGQLDEAERFAWQALAIHKRSRYWRNALNAATTLITLGEVARERGQRWRAKFYFFRSQLAKLGLF